MKKLLVLFFLLVSLFCLNTFQAQSLFSVFASDAGTFFLTTNSPLSTSVKGVKNGGGYVYSFNKSTLNSAGLNLKNITSQSVVLNNKSFNYIQQKLNLKIVSKSNTNNVMEILGYSNKLKNFVYVNGNKVNIQIALNKTNAIVGYPLILQGF